MSIPICPRCNLRARIPRSQNDKRNRKFQPFCAECNKEYQREHYKKNKTDYIRKANSRKSELRKMIQDIKESVPCADCGEFYPYFQMDFDHLDASNKKFGLSRGSDTGSRQAILDEMEKCEVVCALCHRKRTHLRS